MDAKDELLKDLEGALRLYVDPEKIDCVWVNLDPPGYGQGGIGLDQIAARLAALGYRKVTTCSECEYWEKDEGPNEGHYCFNIGDVGSCEAGDYCSFGRRRP